MSEPLDTTPCRRPPASSTKGTFASLRGRTGGITRAVLLCSHDDDGRASGAAESAITVDDLHVRGDEVIANVAGRPDKTGRPQAHLPGGRTARARRVRAGAGTC